MNEENNVRNTTSNYNIRKFKKEENDSTSLSDAENDGDLWESTGSGKITIDTVEINNHHC